MTAGPGGSTCPCATVVGAAARAPESGSVRSDDYRSQETPVPDGRVAAARTNQSVQDAVIPVVLEADGPPSITPAIATALARVVRNLSDQ